MGLRGDTAGRVRVGCGTGMGWVRSGVGKVWGGEPPPLFRVGAGRKKMLQSFKLRCHSIKHSNQICLTENIGPGILIRNPVTGRPNTIYLSFL